MGGTSTKAHRSWWAGPSTLALLFGGVRGWIGSVRRRGGSFGTLLGPEGAGFEPVTSADHRKARAALGL
jgi:hypothetical protein